MSLPLTPSFLHKTPAHTPNHRPYANNATQKRVVRGALHYFSEHYSYCSPLSPTLPDGKRGFLSVVWYHLQIQKINKILDEYIYILG